MVDLLAAVPSVVFGLWGARTLAHVTQPLQGWLNDHLSWLPLFSGQVSATGRTILVAALVLAIMILPIATAICREVFAQTPVLHEEAALALGATRWEMIRYAVFPHARSGIIAGVMLGLGRALGETMAVAMVIGSNPTIQKNLLAPAATMASVIANEFAEAADDTYRSALVEIGLALFLVTIVVNILARLLVWAVTRGAPPRTA
jgi:phosphate transport system permease protein